MRDSSRRLYRYITWPLALGILVLFWFRVDVGRLLITLRGVRWEALAPAILLFVPQILLSSLRWRLIARCPWGDAARAVLAANALNLVTPGKLGDFVRATTAAEGLAVGTCLVIVERLVDVLVVAALGGLLVFVPFPVSGYQQLAGTASLGAASVLLAIAAVARTDTASSRFRMPASLVRRPLAMVPLLATVGLWLLHSLQAALFAVAVHGSAPLQVYFAVAPWLFLASVIPLAPWGLGSREAALATLLGPVDSHEVTAALALLFLLRYWIPGLAGVLVLGRPSLLVMPARRESETPPKVVTMPAVRSIARS